LGAKRAFPQSGGRGTRLSRDQIHTNGRLAPQGECQLLLVQRIEGCAWKLADAAKAAGPSFWLPLDRTDRPDRPQFFS